MWGNDPHIAVKRDTAPTMGKSEPKGTLWDHRRRNWSRLWHSGLKLGEFAPKWSYVGRTHGAVIRGTDTRSGHTWDGHMEQSYMGWTHGTVIRETHTGNGHTWDGHTERSYMGWTHGTVIHGMDTRNGHT